MTTLISREKLSKTFWWKARENLLSKNEFLDKDLTFRMRQKPKNLSMKGCVNIRPHVPPWKNIFLDENVLKINKLNYWTKLKCFEIDLVGWHLLRTFLNDGFGQVRELTKAERNSVRWYEHDSKLHVELHFGQNCPQLFCNETNY